MASIPVFYILHEVKAQRTKVICLQSHSQLVARQECLFSGCDILLRLLVVRLRMKFVHCLKMLLTFSPLARPLLESSSSLVTPSHSCVRVHEPVVQGSVCFWPAYQSVTNKSLHVAFLLASLSRRLASPSLCSCCKVCSGFTTATGSCRARRPRWRAAFGCSLM